MSLLYRKTSISPQEDTTPPSGEQERPSRGSIFSASFFLGASVFMLAFVVRIIYNMTVAHGYHPIYDAALYDILAHSLLNKHCYCIHGYHSTVSRAPLWPWIIAGIYALTGDHSSHVRFFYSLLGSGTCVFVTLFVKDLFGRRIALLTGIIAAVYTGLFIYDGSFFAEPLFTFCFTVFIYALFRLQRITLPAKPDESNKLLLIWRWKLSTEGRCWLAVSGLALVAATLTRPNGSSLLGLLAIWSVILVVTKIQPWPIVLKNFLIVTLMTIVLIAPWTYRNYTITHRFVPVATGMGEVVLGAYNDKVLTTDQSRYSFWMPPDGTKIHDDADYTPDNDKADTARGLAWIRSHLSAMPRMFALHFEYMWKPYSFSLGLPMEEFPGRKSSVLLQYLIPLMSYPMYLLALLGLLFTWKRWKKELIAVYLGVALMVMTNVVFYGTMRFRAPVEPLLVVLAGGTLWWVACRVERYVPRRKSKEAVEPAT